ncbi:glucagon-like peptide 1 receptor isoform X5 [Kogia breviceps]|uniref:glucagon-like peptide 1 receptor isoform X5 n=1 Tax=Kogia breviceps TaxID=27615 RepID=UPI0034D16CBF
MAGAPRPLRLALLLLGAVGRADPRPQGATVSLSETVEKWREYRRQCQRFLTEAPPPATGLFCNRTFDDYACWPDGPPGSFVNVSCPWYLPWASSVLQGHVYRFCTTDGLWLHKDNSSLPWRDLSECEESKRGDRNSPEQQLLSLYIIYTVGYALSFSALVIASAILLGFRHLHCTRNYIHLNLFASFILRALSVFIKDAALKWMYSTAAQQHQWDGLLSYQLLDQELEHELLAHHPAAHSLCHRGELPHLCPGYLHCGVQTEGQSHVQDRHQVQARQVHADTHPPAGDPRGHLRLRDGRARPGHAAFRQAVHRALLHLLPGDLEAGASLEQSQGGDGAGTSLYHADRQPEARGKVALVQVMWLEQSQSPQVC